jgi:hypothetical protein
MTDKLALATHETAPAETTPVITDSLTTTPARRWLWGLAGIVLLSLLPRLFYTLTNSLGYDETHNLMFAALASRGFAPYREVFTGIAPFALLSIEWSVLAWGTGPQVRLLMMAYGVLGVAALFVLVYRQTKTRPLVAATLAALLFSFHPLYFGGSTTINLESAALAFGLLSLWAMRTYREHPATWRLLLSGLLFGLSLAIKVFVPFVPAVILVQMVQHWQATHPGRPLRAAWPALLRMGLWWIAGALLVGLVFALFFDPRLVFQQVVSFRLDLRNEEDVQEVREWSEFAQFVPLFVGAAWGLFRLRRDPAIWVWVAWLLAGSLFLSLHTPLRTRHLIILLPALAALSGIAVAEALAVPRRGWRLGAAALTALTLVWMIAAAGQAARTENFTDSHPVRRLLIDYIEATTAPDDCIVAKENRLHFLTGRLSTPYLSEVSSARLAAGLLTAPDILAEIDRYDCALLANATTFDEMAPDLRLMAIDYFSLHLVQFHPDEPEYDQEIFAVPPDSAVPAAQAADYRLGDQLRVAGWWITPGPWPRGAQVQVTTYWETLRPPDANYKIFLHLVDAQGNTVQSFDHYPFELREEYAIRHYTLNARYMAARELPGNYPYTGLIPTELWQPGHTLKETHRIAIPPDLPPGSYTLQMGMYDEGSMARLPVFAADETDLGSVPLGSVEIQ